MKLTRTTCLLFMAFLLFLGAKKNSNSSVDPWDEENLRNSNWQMNFSAHARARADCQEASHLDETSVTDQPLYMDIAHMEGILSQILNASDAQRLKAILADNFLAYTDTRGIITRNDILQVSVMTAEKRSMGAFDKMRYKSYLTVLPLPGFGALAVGSHTFFGYSNLSQNFVHIWSQQNDHWRLARDIGFGLAPAKVDAGLAKAVKEVDADIFRRFNAKDAEGMRQYYAPDAEFYHDQVGGTFTNAAIVASFRKKFESDTKEGKSLKRTLLPGSLQLFLIPGYGALEVANHKFDITDAGEKHAGVVTIGKFIHLLRKAGNQLQVELSISYNHITHPIEAVIGRNPDL